MIKNEVTIKIKSKYVHRLSEDVKFKKSKRSSKYGYKVHTKRKKKQMVQKEAIKKEMKKDEELIMTSGYPLLFKEAIVNLKDLEKEGQILRLVDDKNQFIAKAYYGRQNKGYGWVLSYKEEEKIDIRFFEKKIYGALNRRMKLFDNPKTNAFRVFNGEGDGIGGLTIDFYNGCYLMTWYSKGIYKFKDHVINALKKMVEFDALYEKKRFDDDGKYIESPSFVLGKPQTFPMVVKENGMLYNIDLDDGAMTGIFLDQREVRKTLRDNYSVGRKVLNTFSYTGAFSTAAAIGGAKSTTSVDLANRSLELTKRNFEVNKIALDNQEIVVGDVFEYFKIAQKNGWLYDTVVLDPPSYAKWKKGSFSASKNYTDLLIDAINVTKKRGVIIASTNCSTFDMAKFKGFVEAAFKKTGDEFTLLESHQLPGDFRTHRHFEEGNYLKVLILKKL